MSEVEVKKIGRVTVGRHDAGRGFETDLVQIAGETVAKVHQSGGVVYMTPCGYCDPAFSGSKTYYSHVLAGVCFQCNGAGTSRTYDSPEQIVRLVKRREADRARRARKEAERLAEQDRKRDEWAAANPEVVAALAEVAADMPRLDPAEQPSLAAEAAYYEASEAAREKWGGFLTDLAAQAEHRPLSEKQTAAVVAAVDRAKAEHAEAEAKVAASRHYGAKGEKVTAATGTVVVRATYDATYGYQTRTGMLLVIEGTGEYAGVTFKVSGTGKTLWDAARGDEVEVSGTIKDHGEYEGVAQTILTRAKIKVTAEAEG